MAAELGTSSVLLSGNQAIAQGLVEAGAAIAAGYPGTPSTEILEVAAHLAAPGLAVRWAPNEKVALDVALGAAMGGARALAAMKHVGLNVAADTFLTAAYTGVGGGLVVVSADDPGMHSSQNEQDNRLYGRFAGVPVLEPADSEEARRFTVLAFELSEEFDLPVLLRTTTRIAHGRSLVRLGEPARAGRRPFARDPLKYVMLPAHARARRQSLLERQRRLAEHAESSPLTLELDGRNEVGVVTSGIAFQHVREVLPEAAILKLGLTNPLPLGRIREFAARVGTLFVVEELEPVLEDALRAAGISVEGKRWFPRAGELSPEAVRRGFERAGVLPSSAEPPAIPRLEPAPRPPVLCPGCPHSLPFLVLRQLGAVVTGDIGCYTLAALPPLSAMDSCVAMGSSIGMASGLAAAGTAGAPVVAAIGDSTFLHGGIQGLMDAVYNLDDITVLILDNGTVAMTGGQPHPGTGVRLDGGLGRPVDLPDLCRALGVQHVSVVDPYDAGTLAAALRAAIEHEGPSVVITNRPCVEAPVKIRDLPFRVDAEACIACQLCMNLGCPALLWTEDLYEGRRKVTIDATCTGCTVCAQLCPAGAITP